MYDIGLKKGKKLPAITKPVDEYGKDERKNIFLTSHWNCGNNYFPRRQESAIFWKQKYTVNKIPTFQITWLVLPSKLWRKYTWHIRYILSTTKKHIWKYYCFCGKYLWIHVAKQLIIVGVLNSKECRCVWICGILFLEPSVPKYLCREPTLNPQGLLSFLQWTSALLWSVIQEWEPDPGSFNFFC